MHWSVTTPEYESYGGYDEPPERGVDWVWVDADTKREALVKGVRELRKIKHGWLSDTSGNPFTGLKVQPAECEHGFCWCELKDCIQRNPDWVFEDICPECEENDKQNCIHEMYTGPAQLSGQKEAKIQEYCNLCLQTREEIDARIGQRFAPSSNNNI